MNIGIIGECMVELFDQGNGSYKRTFGGDTLNTAVYLSRCLTNDSKVHYVTLLGDDSLSDEMVTAWQSEGLHTDTVERLPNTVPGLYMIQTDDEGERSFLYWRNEAPAKKLFQTPQAEALKQKLMGYDWLYFTGITLAILEAEGREQLLDLLKAYRKQGGKVAFDGNYRPRLWKSQAEAQDFMAQAYQQSDIALPSVDDEGVLWQDDNAASIMQRLTQFGCAEVALKCGSSPCMVYSQGDISEHTVTPADNVVDTTAAGDSFNAGYLAQRLQGGSVEASVALGQTVAKQVITQKGAIVPINLPS